MTIVRTYGYYQSPVTTPLVQIVAIVLAVLALIMGAYLLIIGNQVDGCGPRTIRALHVLEPWTLWKDWAQAGL